MAFRRSGVQIPTAPLLRSRNPPVTPEGFFVFGFLFFLGWRGGGPSETPEAKHRLSPPSFPSGLFADCHSFHCIPGKELIEILDPGGPNTTLSPFTKWMNRAGYRRCKAYSARPVVRKCAGGTKTQNQLRCNGAAAYGKSRKWKHFIIFKNLCCLQKLAITYTL